MNTIQEAPSAATESISITARHVLFACPDFRIGGHSTHTLNFAKALRRHGCRAGALVPEPFGDLYDDFVESLDYISVIRRGAERIVEVADDDVAEAIRIYFSDTHTLTEGAGAAALAALMQERERMQGRRIGLVLSGQNIDRAWMRDLLAGETPASGAQEW